MKANLLSKLILLILFSAMRKLFVIPLKRISYQIHKTSNSFKVLL